MSELAWASRAVIFGRHAKTEANLTKEEGRADSIVQGLSPTMGVLPEYYGTARALGIALGRFTLQNGMHIVEVHASDTERTRKTRDLALAQLALSYPDLPPFHVVEPNEYLWEHRKGELEWGGLEGMLRTEAYPPDGRAPDNPDIRHGSEISGGETPNQAGLRLLEGWFYPLLEQSNFQPRQSLEEPIPTIVAIGHTLVTARAIGWLMGEEALGISDRKYKIDGNATGIVLAQIGDEWKLMDDRIVPTDEELAEAELYVTGEG